MSGGKGLNEHRNEGLKMQWTICGKYSFGPLCNHFLVERVGAFCSFATGCVAVINHATRYISTHPFVSPHIALPSSGGGRVIIRISKKNRGFSLA